MRQVIRQILIAFGILLGLVVVGCWVRWVQHPADYRSGDPDPRRYVERTPSFLDEAVGGKSLLNVKERAEATTDLLNLKQIYTYHITQFQLDNGGRLPQSLDELIAAGLDPRHTKDTVGLSVKYEILPGGQQARIYTYGPDRTGNTADDQEIIVP